MLQSLPATANAGRMPSGSEAEATGVDSTRMSATRLVGSELGGRVVRVVTLLTPTLAVSERFGPRGGTAAAAIVLLGAIVGPAGPSFSKQLPIGLATSANL